MKKFYLLAILITLSINIHAQIATWATYKMTAYGDKNYKISFQYDNNKYQNGNYDCMTGARIEVHSNGNTQKFLELNKEQFLLFVANIDSIKNNYEKFLKIVKSNNIKNCQIYATNKYQNLPVREAINDFLIDDKAKNTIRVQFFLIVENGTPFVSFKACWTSTIEKSRDVNQGAFNLGGQDYKTYTYSDLECSIKFTSIEEIDAFKNACNIKNFNTYLNNYKLLKSIHK